MNTQEIYTDKRDQVLLGETPTFMQPRFGHLAPPPLNKHRFIIGRGGVYVEVRSSVMECRLLVSPSIIPFPYGEVETGFRLVNGAIPSSLYDVVKERVKKSCPNEWAGLIVWSASRLRYELFEPTVYACSPSHISYERTLPDDLSLVVDIHSHGLGASYFSKTDDVSEDGIYIAEVFGECDESEPSLASRFVINGIFIRP